MKNYDSYIYRCQKQLKEWNAPLEGWYCVQLIDVIGDDDESEDFFTCELCGCTKVRYVHVMRNDDYFEDISVGCICAGIMEGDIFVAKERERKLKNRAKRRANFIKKKWRLLPNGNHYLLYKGKQLFINYYGNGRYGVVCGMDETSYYRYKPIKDFLSACYAAFDFADPKENCYE